MTNCSYQFKQYVFDPAHNQLAGADGELVLEYRIASLLAYFCQHPQQSLSKTTILQDVWAGRVVNEDSLSVAVSKLRKILGDSRSDPQYIKTIPGVGYQWLPQVEVVDCKEQQPVIARRKKGWLQQEYLRATMLAIVIIVFGLTGWFTYGRDAGLFAVNANDLLSPDAQGQLLKAGTLLSSPEPAPGSASKEDDYLQAIAIYRDILKDYPDTIDAHIGIAEAKYNIGVASGYRVLSQHDDEIISIADYVLEREPTHGRALVLKAKTLFTTRWELDEAERYYARALEALPDDASLYLGYTEFLIARGRFDDAEALLQELRRRQPDYYRYLNLALVYMARGEPERAVAETQRLINSEITSSIHNYSLQRLGVIMGDDDLAMEHFLIIARQQGLPPTTIAGYQKTFQRGGIKALYSQLLDEKTELNLGQYVPPISWARYAVVAGRPDEAVHWLEQAVAERQAMVLFTHVDPHYDPIRNDPGFRELLAKIPH
ncbi:tetratricopeptide repeat protein [Pseudidiomarina sp.]|uniref:tetratricopeptide repeat protein n=1 Tax=Pseudidiomarina sp. TaxID=2081707 RepID=UPI00299E970A|nr:tetratricopeptide repeat protein [Pseudidiomarina sp.]MDX1706734.1 tetratricopeptide repeat protein [Pseudidiomarina sp.]